MKRVVAFSSLTFSLLLSTWAYASTYLDTAALLLDQSRRSVEWVERRLSDRQLAKAAHLLAEARVKAGQEIEVPKEADRAHPHLLLALETAERAFFAAKEGDTKRFLRLRRLAREEERTYRELLQQAKQSMPDLSK